VIWYRAFENPERTSEMIELALASYYQALRVYTMLDNPEEWAHTMQSISLAMIDRVKGSRFENLTEAIRYSKKSMKVYSEEANPSGWANTMINLGSIYAQLPGEDTAENMENALQCLIKALRVHTRDSNPVTWATLQVNLGTTYQHRVLGDPAENIEQTIRLYANAIEVFTRETYPERWAMLNSNLGNAWIRRINGDPEENLQEAITRFQAALDVKSERIPPIHLAMVKLNMATAYLKSKWKDSMDYIEKSLILCRKALEVCRGNYPVEAAMIDFTMGNACLRQKPDQGVENLEMAKLHFIKALEVFTPESMSSENLTKNLALAEVALLLNDNDTAESALVQAVSSFDMFYKQSFTRDGRNLAIEKGAPACFLAAFCAASCGNLSLASELLDHGKTRVLSSCLALDRAMLHEIPSEVKEVCKATTEKIAGLEYKLSRGVSPEQYVQLASDLKCARQELDEQIAFIRIDHPYFIQDAVTLTDVRRCLPDSETALVEFCVTDHGTVVLLVLNDSKMESQKKCFSTTSFNSSSLNRLSKKWFDCYNVFKAGNKGSEDIIVWENCMLSVTQEIYTNLFQPVDEALNLMGIRRLIISPHRFLHVLPLHLMRSAVSEKKEYLFNKYEISYIPSASVLYHVSRISKTSSDFGKDKLKQSKEYLVAVTNPTGDLKYADLETESVRMYFEQSMVLAGEDAVQDRVVTESKNAGYLHFACHGAFNLDNPDRTGLILSSRHESSSKFDSQVLDCGNVHACSSSRAVFFQPESKTSARGKGNLFSLLDICHQLDLVKVYLVVLSACESGLVDTAGAADEVIGLPAGFLQAGADVVVSSLWLVDDSHSRELITDFYRFHIAEGHKPSAALRLAQKMMMERGVSPYYWGGFVVAGTLL
ncbi:CHAT domain-containing protein, partial [bacterium]|nr:CHAT domain-containing protein [bacterium]